MSEIIIVTSGGPQGPKGDKGDTGDVTPEALAAQAAAEAAQAAAESAESAAASSASSASSSATAAATSATAAATSATAAANSASATSTSAGNAAADATNAANSATAALSSANAAASSATSASTSATNAANSATSASNSANAAGTSASAASASETNAAASATSAATSATTSESSATSAANSATSAGSSATSAANSATNAAASATAAASSATAAATSATAAAASASAASTSQASASSSATAAAASAAQAAAIAAGLNYQGGIAAASLPSSSTAGHCWLITTAGTIYSTTFELYDLAIYRSASSYDRIPANNLLGATLSMVSSRRTSGYVQCDGATTARAAGIYGPFDATLNPRGWLAGVAALTPLIRVTVPIASSTAEIWGASSANNALASVTAWSIGIAWSGNDLVLRCNGATPATDYRTVTWTGLRTTWSGQEITLEPSIVAGTGTPTLKVNGVLTAGTAADGAGTDPDWLSTSLVSTWHVVGYNWPIGVAPRVVPILGIITDSESVAWRLRGVLPFWVVAGGHAANLITNGGFETNTNGWASFAGGAISRITSDFYAGAACLQVIASSSGDGVRTDASGGPAAQPTAKRYSTRFAAKSVSGNTTLGIARGNGSQQVQVTLSSSWQVFDVAVNGTESASASTNLLAFYLTGAGTFLLDDISARQDGASTVPVVQPCLVLGDASHIGDNQGRLLGCLPVTDEQRWRIVVRTHTSAVQDVQAFGGSIFMEANRSRIDSCAAVQNSGGALSVQLGSASGGSDLVASTSVASGSAPTELTLALRYPPTQNLWVRRVAGAGTAPFTVTLEGHRIGGNP